MDASRFDRWTRVVASGLTRRGFGQAVGASLGIVLLGNTPGGDAKNKTKKCGSCRHKKKGKCKGQKPDNAPCEGDGRCLAGACQPPPTCDPPGTTPCVAADCCSGQCCPSEILPPPGVCCPSTAGEPCFANSDCLGLSSSCIGYRCT